MWPWPLSWFLKKIIFRVRLLSVVHGHSVFSSPPQRSMTSDFEGFSIPDLIHYIYFLILILEKEPVYPFSMLSAKKGNYWYHFYNVFGMTRSLTGDWTRDFQHLCPDHLLVVHNLPDKFEDIKPRCCLVINQTSGLCKMSPWRRPAA